MKKMVDRECPKIVTLQDGPFSDRHKAGVPLELCMHLRKRTNPLRSGLDRQTIRVLIVL